MNRWPVTLVGILVGIFGVVVFLESAREFIRESSAHTMCGSALMAAADQSGCNIVDGIWYGSILGMLAGAVVLIFALWNMR